MYRTVHYTVIKSDEVSLAVVDVPIHQTAIQADLNYVRASVRLQQIGAVKVTKSMVERRYRVKLTGSTVEQ